MKIALKFILFIVTLIMPFDNGNKFELPMSLVLVDMTIHNTNYYSISYSLGLLLLIFTLFMIKKLEKLKKLLIFCFLVFQLSFVSYAFQHTDNRLLIYTTLCWSLFYITITFVILRKSSNSQAEL